MPDNKAYEKNSFKALVEEEREEDYEIRTVVQDSGLAGLGIGNITVDSAPDASRKANQGDAFETKPSPERIILKTANGVEMGHYGEDDVTFRSGDDVVGLSSR